jgi:drug/metabolite transporter (DMT)-like permease
LTLGGFALALVAVWLVARTGDAAIHVRELGLPVLAGMGFGCFIVLIGRANAGAVFWPLVAARVASLLVLTVIVPSSGRHIWPSGGHRTVIALTGLFDAGGNALLVAAAQAGRLDVAGVLASLYPAGTVLLAWRVMGEHITGWQFLGLMASLAAIAAIASP